MKIFEIQLQIFHWLKHMEMFFNSKQLPKNKNNQSAIFLSFKPLFFTDKLLESTLFNVRLKV